MRLKPAFTLVEILIVVTLFGLTFFPFYFAYVRSQSNQALVVSTEQFSDILRSAHVFSREAKDKKIWAVRKESLTSYAMLSSAGSGWKIEKSYQLEKNVSFVDDFFIKFKIGTGEIDEDKHVILENKYGKQMKVKILKAGVVEVYALN